MFFTDILTVSVSDSHCTILKMKDLPVPEDALHDDVSRFFFLSFLHYSVFLSFAFLENFPNLTRLLLCVFLFFIFKGTWSPVQTTVRCLHQAEMMLCY